MRNDDGFPVEANVSGAEGIRFLKNGERPLLGEFRHRWTTELTIYNNLKLIATDVNQDIKYLSEAVKL